MDNTSGSSSYPVTVTDRAAGTDDLFEQMAAVTQKIAERAYALFESRGFTDGNDLQDWYTAESELLKPVALEIVEGPAGTVIYADVPGFQPPQLHVQVDGARILIHGANAVDPPEADASNIEALKRAPQQIFRSLELSRHIQASQVRADLENGVLRLSLGR